MQKKILSLLIFTFVSCVQLKGEISENTSESSLSSISRHKSTVDNLILQLKQANTSAAGAQAGKPGPCYCSGGLCACCSRILMSAWNQKACVNITYDPDEFSFTAKVSMNDRVLYTRTVSGKNPRPVCVPVPRIPAVRACIRFYNIYFQGRNVHACINMEGKFSDTTLFKVGLDCVRLGANGVALVKPEDGGGIGQVEWLPDDPEDANDEDNSNDYDDYDEEDDYDY